MMESERKPLWSRNKKKVKPRVVDVDEESADMAAGDLHESVTSSPEAVPPAADANFVSPSAPELATEEPDQQKELFRRLYLLLTAHVTMFTVITVLFVYVPHLRNIMRRNIFDKLLLTSYIATPLLVVVVLYLLFPVLRRRFAFIGLVVITATIGWLLSYVLSVQDARTMLISVGSADACSLTTYAASFVPRISITSRKSLAYSPIFMLASNAVFHSIFSRSVQAVVPAIATTGLMTHFAFNARSLVKNETLNLRPNEYCFALVQMYMSGGIYQSVKSLFQRQTYQPI